METVYRKTLTAAMLLSCVLCLCSCTGRGHSLRLMYWNIQNGMWAGQEDGYSSFVSYVKSMEPDICVWCEAQSIYRDSTSEKLAPEERFLVDGWPALAAEYGHSYVYTGGHRDNYPQVITSRYPIKGIMKITGEKPDSVVTHGAGWAAIDFAGKTINIVCLHTWPMQFAFGAEDRTESAAEHGGDLYRRKEIEYICRHTVLPSFSKDNGYWMMMGDFNAVSRTDNSHYGYPDNDTRFLVHDYIASQTPYIDVIKALYPDEVKISTAADNRIDFVYCSPALFSKVSHADIVNNRYTAPVKDSSGKTGFHRPSDHLPLIVDFVFQE